jgi:hypothetical protein
VTLALGACSTSQLTLPDGGTNGTLSLTRVEPPSAPAQDGGYYVNVWGENFLAPVTLMLGQSPTSQVEVISPERILVTTTGGANPGTVDVSVTNGDGQTSTLPKAFTFLAPGAVDIEIADCVIQWPTSFYAADNGATEEIYGRVEATNLTNVPGEPQGLSAQLGYGPAGTDPSTWTWTDAAYNANCADCQVWAEYHGTLEAPTDDGDYSYAYRFQYGDTGWRYCSTQAGLGFQASEVGQMTVGPPLPPAVSYCSLQYPSPQNPGGKWPATGTAGAAGPTMYGRVVVPGVTGSGSASSQVTAQVGYGAVNSDPSTWTNWCSASYNQNCWCVSTASGPQCGMCQSATPTGQDEYDGAFTLPSAGTYNFTFRYSVSGGPWTYCDQSGVTNGQYTSGLGVITTTGSGQGGSCPGGPTGSGDGGTQSTVTFSVLYGDAQVGQNVYVTGGAPELGNWSTANALELSGASFPMWSGTVSMTQGEAFTFKFLVEDSTGHVTAWEADPNRSWTVPSTATSQYSGGAFQGTDGGY